jgi:hypothetical protein
LAYSPATVQLLFENPIKKLTLRTISHPTSPLSVPIPMLMGMLPTAKTVQTQRFLSYFNYHSKSVQKPIRLTTDKKDPQMYNIHFDFIKTY